MVNKIYERAKLNKFKAKSYSERVIKLISQSNLVQLFIWIDETKVIYKNNLFRMARDEKYIVYQHFVFNHYNNEPLSPILALEEFFDLTYVQALYILNYFYFKVNKSDIEDYIVENYKRPSLTEMVDGDMDLNYIITEDSFRGINNSYYYTRAIAYLCETRKIDKDIVLNFIKQGFIKMDMLNNLCFITYKDNITKDDVIAITRKGTTSKVFKNNLVKEHYTGFFYAKKGSLELSEYDTIYIFESCIDLLSFLSLVKARKITLPEDEYNCFISLNGADNRKYLQKLLYQYPSIEKIVLCLDNDSSGIKGADSIKKEYVKFVIGTPPELETVYLYEFLDLRTILKDITEKYGYYCKDWNDALRCKYDFSYDI